MDGSDADPRRGKGVNRLGIPIRLTGNYGFMYMLPLTYIGYSYRRLLRYDTMRDRDSVLSAEAAPEPREGRHAAKVPELRTAFQVRLIILTLA